jgi:hypothetical protein
MPQQIARGYFGMGPGVRDVTVTSSSDFIVHVWARNVDAVAGGVQVLTPPSEFRGSGSTGAIDGLVLDVGAQSGIDLGCIGGSARETIRFSAAGNARVTVFLTVDTASAATVKMTGP